MKRNKLNRRQWSWLTFGLVFSLCLAIGAAISLATPATAQTPEATPEGSSETTTQATAPAAVPGAYAGSAACANCHKDIHTDWTNTRHAQAFSSPVFQRDWSNLSQQTSCLECHTTGFNSQSGTYAEAGVTCESCHGPFQPNHPAQPMPIKPDADLCARCHSGTTAEWKASPHNKAGVQCQSCHNPHSQVPMAESITALCTNCHKERGDSYTHSTHANAGLQCSNCHMYRAPRTEDPIGGLVPTGHTFSVGSDACIGCHQEKIHTRDELVKLGGVTLPTPQVSVDELNKTIVDQDQTISSLKATLSARLYTGLIQGAIIGLVTGGAVAWVVGRRVRIVEVDDDGR
jgi:predicted CXXCH cytochrome family protein